MRKSRAVGRFFMLAAVCVVLVGVGVAAVMHYYPVRHVGIINRYAEQHGLEPELVFAVIHAESRFNTNSVSVSGASGLMQIMESTAYWLAPQIGMYGFSYGQIFDPEINIRLGTYYLSTLIARYGNVDVALAAYNAGGGNVDSWLADYQYSLDGQTLHHIPFPETRYYVRRVAENKERYTMILRAREIFLPIGRRLRGIVR